MKFILSILLSLGIANISLGSHIVGGDIYYTYLGGNNYQVNIVIYRDCASTGAPFDDPLSLGIFNSSNSLVKSIDIALPASVRLPLVFENPCVTPPSGICVERAIYSAIVNLPPTSGGYTLAYQRCCRGPAITNLKAPEDTGLTLKAFIPGTNTVTWGNSSPKFKNYPPLVICNNENLNFDHSAIDPDGDVLTYSLVAPYAGATDKEPQPSPPPAPPYNLVQWQNSFGNAIPLGTGSKTTIDPNTGKLFVDAYAQGLFVVGIQVNEYRNGKLLSSTIRDFIFRVVNCVIQLQADIAPQINYCQGFTINFVNKSYGGTNYKWDFGDPTKTTDVSTSFSPSYTYPDTGFYQVKLIVNPGFPCTDTTTELIGIHEKMDISFTSIDSMCITGNQVIFDGNYTGPDKSRFTWDFGQYSDRGRDSLLDPPLPVSFSVAGHIPVKVSSDFLNCHDEYIEDVFIYDHLDVQYELPPGLQCFPYTARFINNTLSYAPLSFDWDFGDGASSTLRNPVHPYSSTGIFDVELTVIQRAGCYDTVTVKKPELIHIYPSPTSQFTVTPKETDAFNAEFSIFDESFDRDYMTYWLNDTISTTEMNPKHTYYEGGYHDIIQVVKNTFGCTDTTSQTVYVKPEVTVYIPNTFTPNSDNYNNVWKPVVYDAFYWKLSVYNRWGEQVYYSEDANEGWDGMFKGLQSPSGTYSYTVQYSDVFTLLKHELKGHFNLIR